MHCKACDHLLSDAEAVAKDPVTKTFSELCSRCLGISDSSISEEELSFCELGEVPDAMLMFPTQQGEQE